MITILIWLVALAVSVPAVVRAALKFFGETLVPGSTLVKPLVGLALSIVVAAFAASAFGQVPAGHRGVVLQFGAVTGEVKSEGLYVVIPGVQSIALMDVQVHADKSKATAASHDLQNVATEVTVNYRLDAKRVAEVYRDLRDQYVPRVMVPAIQEAVKSATAQFNAENLVIERPRVKDQIETLLSSRLSKHGILVDGISITDFAFSEDFANAIEAKVTSQQLALKAQNDVQITRNEQLKKYEVARADSYTTVTNAKALAEAIRIQAQSISAQGGKDYVNLKAIEKWDGGLPTWIGSGNAVPFVNIAPPGK